MGHRLPSKNIDDWINVSCVSRVPKIFSNIIWISTKYFTLKRVYIHKYTFGTLQIDVLHIIFIEIYIYIYNLQNIIFCESIS